MKLKPMHLLIVAVLLVVLSQFDFGTLPTPGPPKPSAPFKSSGFAVMILKEASGKLPPGQTSILNSAEVLGYCRDKCVQVDGKPFFRAWDDDYTAEQLRQVPQEIAEAYVAVREQAGGKLPWIAISTGSSGVSQELPGTVAETMELLRKWGEQ